MLSEGIAGFQQSVTAYNLNPRLEVIPNGARLPEEDSYNEDIGDSTDSVNPVYNSVITEDLTRSLVTISNSNPAKHATLYKSFDKIPTLTSYQGTEYEEYYSFGTTLFMDDAQENPIQAGGIGFFMNSIATTGYLVRIDTTASSSFNNSKKDLKILKLQNGLFKPMSDSQQSDISTLAGIYGGRAYRIDIKVKATELINEIKVYVNGFLVSAKDIKDSDGTPEDPTPITINAPTKSVVMFSQKGKVSFDYVYGIQIDKLKYEDNEYQMNVFDGQYSKNLINFNFGENIFTQTSEETGGKGNVEEFGPVARELRYLKLRYNSRPADPLWVSTGINNSVEIVGNRLNNFGGEIYVLNNSGTFVPLEDGEDYSFYIPGTGIGKFGEFQYSVDFDNEYNAEDPLIFQSNWIQKSGDAAALEKWIRSIWAKRQMTVKMNIFGNPLLSIGDIIRIKYDYQDISETKNFIIINIQHSFSGGLSTSVVCRSL